MPEFFLPQPYVLIDEDTLLLTMPWATLSKFLATAGTYRATYQAAHQLLLDQLWVFTDQLTGEMGSDEQMIALADVFRLGPELPAVWEDRFLSVPDFLPRDEQFWMFLIQATWSRVFNEGYFPLTMWTWHVWVMLGAVSMDERSQFQVGLIQRITVKFSQHRVAKTLENLLCLDSRGRPVLV